MSCAAGPKTEPSVRYRQAPAWGERGTARGRPAAPHHESVERKLVELVASVFDPAHHASERQQAACDRQLDVGGHADEGERDADCGQHGHHARLWQAKLLADGRDVFLERAHETYTAATKNVNANITRHTPETTSAVRMFFEARRRLSI